MRPAEEGQIVYVTEQQEEQGQEPEVGQATPSRGRLRGREEEEDARNHQEEALRNRTPAAVRRLRD